MKFIIFKAILIALLISSTHIHCRKNSNPKKSKRILGHIKEALKKVPHPHIGSHDDKFIEDIKVLDFEDRTDIEKGLMFFSGFFTTVGIIYCKEIAMVMRKLIKSEMTKTITFDGYQFDCKLSDYKRFAEWATNSDEERAEIKHDAEVCFKPDDYRNFIHDLDRGMEIANFYCKGNQSATDYAQADLDNYERMKVLLTKGNALFSAIDFTSGTGGGRAIDCNFYYHANKLYDKINEQITNGCTKLSSTKQNTGTLNGLLSRFKFLFNTIKFAYLCADREEVAKNATQKLIVVAVEFILRKVINYFLAGSLTAMKLTFISVKILMTVYLYYKEHDDFKKLDYLGQIAGLLVRIGLELVDVLPMEPIFDVSQTTRKKRRSSFKRLNRFK